MAAAVSPLLQDLAVVLAVAAVTTLVFHRLRQPVVLGYLLAGLIVGPHTPPFTYVHDFETVRLLGDLGVIFLLFALGLDFNFRKLRRVGATALVSGTLQVALMIWLGYVVGRAFGLEPLSSLFLGAIVSISSTVIIVKVVHALGRQKEEWAQIVFGILIVEDVLAVLMLTLLSAAGGVGGADGALVEQVLRLVVSFALFVAVALVLGLLVVPRLVTFVARLGVEEVLVVTAVALGFGLAIVGGLLGFSPALGAFIMGAIVSESAAHRTVEEKMGPIRDLFTAIFFVTIGMLVDPSLIVAHWPLILAVTAAVIAGKIVAATFATFITGHDVPTSVHVGFGLAQVGEFSFIIASLAMAVGVTDAPLFAVSVSVAGITAFTTPYLIRHAPRATRAFERVAPKPLLTYARLYRAWVERLYDLRKGDPTRRRATRAAVQAVASGAVAIAVVVAGGASVRHVGRFVAAHTGFEQAPFVLGWVAVGVVAVPFLLLYARAQHAFAEALTDAALPQRVAKSPNAAAVRGVLVRTFFLGGLVVAGTLLLVFSSPFLPTGLVLGVVLTSVAVAAVVLYAALRRFQRRVEEALLTALGEEPQPETHEERKELLDLIREKYPWAMTVREFDLPARAVAFPLTIRRLHLRGRTGATIMAIHREGGPIFNPPPDTPLLPKDRLVLLGDEDQVHAAERVLEREGSGEPPTAPPATAEVRVGEGSPLAGRTLAALHLPDRTGATVLGIRRGSEHLANPAPTTEVAPGDVLVVLGTPEQVRKVEALNRGASGHFTDS